MSNTYRITLEAVGATPAAALRYARTVLDEVENCPCENGHTCGGMAGNACAKLHVEQREDTE